MSEARHGEELPGFFGFTPEETERLLSQEQPEDQQAVYETLFLLSANLEHERLADIVHKPSDAYGGFSSIVDALVQDPQATLEKVRESFDWPSNS